MSGSKLYQKYYATDKRLWDLSIKINNSIINMIAIPGIDVYEAEAEAKNKIKYSASAQDISSWEIDYGYTLVSYEENTSWNPP
jgi:hypothetical protein